MQVFFWNMIQFLIALPTEQDKTLQKKVIYFVIFVIVQFTCVTGKAHLWNNSQIKLIGPY